MLSIISFFSFNLEFTNVKKLRAVTFDEFLFITALLLIMKNKAYFNENCSANLFHF